MENKINESIFDGATTIIPMANVAFIEKRPIRHEERHTRVLAVVMNGTTLNDELGEYHNAIFLFDEIDGEQEATNFMKAWSYFRYEKDIKE